MRLRVVVQNPETSAPGETERNRVRTSAENSREAPESLARMIGDGLSLSKSVLRTTNAGCYLQICTLI